MTGWRAAAASAAIYTAVTAVFGRDLLSNIAGAVAGDQGDPLFVASILHWNATAPPLTEAWWQFPIFAPTRDALTFSEHLLGISPIATPLHWLTRNALVTYNIVALLTFPLCGLAMFALAHRLTRNAAAAFLAGLAFAFAPYRISHLPHLQMLALFWAPLALLGLHAYIESRRPRWLALYAVAWMLQGAANGYMLVFLSLLVALWVLWFVVARRDWAALAAIGGATIAAAIPLVPIVDRYMEVHALHGFRRDLAEMRLYSADLAAVLCAPSRLTFWSWLQVGCRAEGELFPGLAAAAASLVAAWHLLPEAAADTRWRRSLVLINRVLIAAGLLFAAVACTVIVAGPWVLEVGPLRVSASSVAKPVMLAVGVLVVGFMCSPRVHAAVHTGSTPGFYLIAALLTWILALGPTVNFMGEPRGIDAPFAWLASLPGISGLRAPARFWLLTTMCLSLLVGFVATQLMAGRRRFAAGCVVVIFACVLAIDGWARIPAAPVRDRVPDARALENGTVLTLPMDSVRDIEAGFRAVTGGWRSVNGYSGYFPVYYAALLHAAQDEDESMLLPFLSRADLDVVVEDAADGLKRMIVRQPGAVVTATGSGAVQFRIPRRNVLRSWDPAGERLRIAGVRASCAQADVWRVADNDEGTRWHCGPQRPGQELLVDLGQPQTVGGIVQNLSVHHAYYPRHLLVESSADGVGWETIWNGSVRGLLIAQAIDTPGPPLRVAVALDGRRARYIRLRQMATHAEHAWSVAEIEVVGAKPSND